MPRSSHSEESYEKSETGNWNVADSFSKIKIMVPLTNCDIYEDIALYGYSNFLEELASLGIPIDELRILGLKRLINELIKLAKNCRFAMKTDGTKKDISDILKKLHKIKDNIFPYTYIKVMDQRDNSSVLKISPTLFEKTLFLVSEIKSDINTPLNKNHLIFVDKEEFDPREFKKRIKNRIINLG